MTIEPPAENAAPPHRAGEHRGPDDIFLKTVGTAIREAREQRGFTRRALSTRASVSERYLAHLEAGDGNASIALLRRVTTALDIDLADLLSTAEHRPERALIRQFLGNLPPERLAEVLHRLGTEFGLQAAVRRRRIALIGMRGAGKSTLGLQLSRSLRRPFIELDREIERDAGISLSEIFLLYGQGGYRRIELRCLQRLIEQPRDIVLSVDGGIVSEPGAYELLLSNFYTVWIKAAPEEHVSRVIAQGDIPPLGGSAEAMEDLKRILAAREPFYSKADVRLDTSGQGVDDSFAALRHLLTDKAPKR